RAPLTKDVPGRASLNYPPVRRGLFVDAPEPQVRDGARRCNDRRSALFRVHARVGRTTVKPDLHCLRMRRAQDDLPDRRGLVVHIAESRLQALLVERGRTEQADLLFRSEQKLDAPVRT